MSYGRQKGYTILEVLIFIAVSSLMFVAAVGAINGRQNQVQFVQSTRDLDAKLRDIINDVTTSYYPSSSTVDCQITPLGKVEIGSSTNVDLGTSNECIYVGKALQFQPDGERIRIYSLAGRRYADEQQALSASVKDARPVAVGPTVENYTLLYGLKITEVIRPISPTVATNYGSIGIISNFGSSSVSEAQSVQIGGIRGSQVVDNETSALAIINQLTDDAGFEGQPGFIEKNTAEGVIICLESPEGRKASISLGVKGASTTLLQVDDYNRGCDL